jgi:hypothetical protein
MNKPVPPKKGARPADAAAQSSNDTPNTEAQLRRDRQQVGVAQSLAAEAERLFPALSAGVLTPERLVEQAKYVLSKAKLQTERHGEGEISEEHGGHMITSVRKFAIALDQVGVKVAGLQRVRQSQYVDVMKLWEEQSPGNAHLLGWRLSHLRRLLWAIGRPDVIPRYNANIELLRREGIDWRSDEDFLENEYVDWVSGGIDVETIFEAMRDPAKRVGAKMMHFFGMSMLEAASWQAVDPGACDVLLVEGDERRGIREAKFSRDPEYAAKQKVTVKEAWEYCRQHDRPTICPPGVSPRTYANRLRSSIRTALEKFPDEELTPMHLCEGFFCQVFRDHAGMSWQEAQSSPRLKHQVRRFARAWNEAKRQLGEKGAWATEAQKGTPFAQSQSDFIAHSLLSISVKFPSLGVAQAWVGDVDASAGKCLFVQLLDASQASALPRIQQLTEKEIFVKLRVVRVLGAADVPEGAAAVMTQSMPN